MWSSRLFWKLFLLYAGLTMAFVFVFLIVFTRRQQQLVDNQMLHSLREIATVVHSRLLPALETESLADDEQLHELVKSMAKGTKLRITLIAADGGVVADSSSDAADVKQMEKLADRAELLQARSADFGSARRVSSTMGVAMDYVALKIATGSGETLFLRVAKPLDTGAADMLRFAWLLAVGFGVPTMVVTWLVVRRILQPLEQLYRTTKAIRADEPIKQSPDRDKIAELARSFADMHRDMTDRVEQLRDNSERLSTILGSMVEGVLAVDAEQRILMANDASRRLLDFSSPDVVGRALLEATRNRVVREAITGTFASLSACNKEFETPGKVRRILSMRATPLPGIPCPGVVVVLHDMSEVRRLENVRQEFMTNVSHELKTPLASVKAYAETLRLGAINDPNINLAFVGKIEEQSDRLNELIQDLLQIARVESGQQAFDIDDVPLAQVVAGSVESRRAEAEGAGVLINLEPTDSDVLVRADEDGLRTIIDNLVTNAIKYTPEGGTITVAWSCEPRAACLSVSDTGIGIAPEHLDRVFERFYRVDKARSRELGGTGLGLSIVKHLTQAFGGSVGVTSEVGRGSRFEVRIPLTQA